MYTLNFLGVYLQLAPTFTPKYMYTVLNMDGVWRAMIPVEFQRCGAYEYTNICREVVGLGCYHYTQDSKVCKEGRRTALRIRIKLSTSKRCSQHTNWSLLLIALLFIILDTLNFYVVRIQQLIDQNELRSRRKLNYYLLCNQKSTRKYIHQKKLIENLYKTVVSAF